MFQYAFIRALSLRSGSDFWLDISEYKTYFRPYELEIFNIKENYFVDVPFYEKNNFHWLVKAFLSKFNKSHYKERAWYFEADFLNKKDGYFDWYFQNENYFKDFESTIRKDFSFSKKFSDRNLALLDSLSWKNLVAVHVRRWDYLKKPDFHPICSLDYYDKSILYIYKRIKNPVFIFFSDDLEWCKENFNWETYVYVDWNVWEDAWQDMALMSKCHHNIIANSSFSWWWAWLNRNEEKVVIAPRIWSYRKSFNLQSVPSDWIQF